MTELILSYWMCCFEMYFYGVGGGGVGDVLLLKMRGGGFVLLFCVLTFRGCLQRMC